MKNLREYLEEQINENLIQAVLSAGRNKDGISKIKIRPIRLKGQICVSNRRGSFINRMNSFW